MTLRKIQNLTLIEVEKLRTAAGKGSAAAARDFVRYSVWRKISAIKSPAKDSEKEEAYNAIMKRVKIVVEKVKTRG